MSFWSTVFVQQLNTGTNGALNKENCTLEDVLDAEDVLQECKTSSPKLIKFLLKDEIVEKLVTYVVGKTTEQPNEDAEAKENRIYKFPYMACEVICCEIEELNKKIAGTEDLLKLFFSYLQGDCSNTTKLPSQDEYFMKAFNHLMNNRHNAELITLFIQNQQQEGNNIMAMLLQNMRIWEMDTMFLRLIRGGLKEKLDEEHAAADTELKEQLQQWWSQNGLLSSCVEQLNPGNVSEVNENIFKLLTSILTAPDLYILSNQLRSDEAFVSGVISKIFSNTNSSIFIDGTTFLCKLIESCVANPAVSAVSSTTSPNFSTAQQQAKFEYTRVPIRLIVAKIPELAKLLITVPQIPHLSASGEQQPFGEVRIKVLELLISLLTTAKHQDPDNVAQEFAKANLLQTCFDLFFQYSRNNFLHNLVADMTIVVLNSTTETAKQLQTIVLTECKLIEKILEHVKSFDNGRDGRYGYSGHLTILANAIVQASSSESSSSSSSSSSNTSHIKSVLAAHVPGWEDFVNTQLKEVNAIERGFLVEAPPIRTSATAGLETSPTASFDQLLKEMEQFEAAHEQEEAERAVSYEQNMINDMVASYEADHNNNNNDNYGNSNNKDDFTFDDDDEDMGISTSSNNDNDDNWANFDDAFNNHGHTSSSSNDDFGALASKRAAVPTTTTTATASNNDDNWADFDNFDAAFSSVSTPPNNHNNKAISSSSNNLDDDSLANFDNFDHGFPSNTTTATTTTTTTTTTAASPSSSSANNDDNWANFD